MCIHIDREGKKNGVICIVNATVTDHSSCLALKVYKLICMCFSQTF